jgi:hypothetical protein
MVYNLHNSKDVAQSAKFPPRPTHFPGRDCLIEKAPDVGGCVLAPQVAEYIVFVNSGAQPSRAYMTAVDMDVYMSFFPLMHGS